MPRCTPIPLSRSVLFALLIFTEKMFLCSGCSSFVVIITLLVFSQNPSISSTTNFPLVICFNISPFVFMRYRCLCPSFWLNIRNLLLSHGRKNTGFCGSIYLSECSVYRVFSFSPVVASYTSSFTSV